MAGFVDARLLLAIRHVWRERSKTDCRASRGCLARRLGRRLRRESRQGECQADRGHDRGLHCALPPVAKPSLILPQLTRKEVKLTTMEPARPLVAGFGQPRVIKVFIRSAGQTRLSGALVNASLDGLLPLGRPTMWWLKCASTPAGQRPVTHFHAC